MNFVFIKEVADTTIDRKDIKFNINNIGNEEYILEIKISNKISSEILRYNNLNKENINKKESFVTKFLRRYHMKSFTKNLKKIITLNSLSDSFAIFSNNINVEIRKYLKDILNEFNINEYVCENTMQSNLWKYIEEYKGKNDFSDCDIIPAILIENTEYLDFDMLEDINLKYKEISILVQGRLEKSFVNKINDINEEYGSCIEIVKKMPKDLKRFNVYIFVDKSKLEYVKYKFNKKSCYVDFTNRENDRYNEKYLKLKENIENGKYYINKINEMYELYGKITVSNVLVY